MIIVDVKKFNVVSSLLYLRPGDTSLVMAKSRMLSVFILTKTSAHKVESLKAALDATSIRPARGKAARLQPQWPGRRAQTSRNATERGT